MHTLKPFLQPKRSIPILYFFMDITNLNSILWNLFRLNQKWDHINDGGDEQGHKPYKMAYVLCLNFCPEYPKIEPQYRALSYWGQFQTAVFR